MTLVYWVKMCTYSLNCRKALFVHRITCVHLACNIMTMTSWWIYTGNSPLKINIIHHWKQCNSNRLYKPFPRSTSSSGDFDISLVWVQKNTIVLPQLENKELLWTFESGCHPLGLVITLRDVAHNAWPTWHRPHISVARFTSRAVSQATER